MGRGRVGAGYAAIIAAGVVRSLIAVVVFVASAAGDASAQRPPADAPPVFAAASVKRSAPGASPMTTSVETSPGGRWSVLNATLRLILMTTYGVAREHIDGGPSWLDTERFDIVATAGTDVPPRDVTAMAKQLLADRFGLRVHIESRPLEVYAMVRRGELGPGLRANPACTAAMEARARGEDVAVPAEQSTPCSRGTIKAVDGVRQLRFTGYAIMSIIPLAGLSSELRGVIVDRTGLTGAFDIAIDYVPETPSSAGAPAASGILPAVERQLGLRFERRREPIDVVVIDGVSMPAPD